MDKNKGNQSIKHVLVNFKFWNVCNEDLVKENQLSLPMANLWLTNSLIVIYIDYILVCHVDTSSVKTYSLILYSPSKNQVSELQQNYYIAFLNNISGLLKVY